jgi:hypothetical protein
MFQLLRWTTCEKLARGRARSKRGGMLAVGFHQPKTLVMTEIANQRGGEWMGADKISIQEFGLWTRFHSCTSASFSCQVHAATEVLLNLGARNNQQPQHTRSANTHDTAAGSPNWSDHFCWTSPHTGRGNWSDRFSKPVRLLLSINSPKTLPRENLPPEPLLLWTRIGIAQQRLPCSKTLHDSPQD